MITRINVKINKNINGLQICCAAENVNKVYKGMGKMRNIRRLNGCK